MGHSPGSSMRTCAPKGVQKHRKNDNRFRPAYTVDCRESSPFRLVSDLIAASSSRRFSTWIGHFLEKSRAAGGRILLSL